GKPILADGIPADARNTDAQEVEARALAAGVAYRALRMGVLLANRQGPLNAMEYTDFVSAVQSVADPLSSLADIPEMADTIARARDLDATCAQLDAQIGLNVDSPEPLGPAQAGALAADLGLVDRGGHRHVRLGPNGELVFTMSLTGSPQRLGFLLDVPRTAEALDGFAAMVSCAQDAAARLSGQLADDSGRPISNEALGTISRQLRQRYESLEAIGLSAGSPLAMRVFN
ncbi:MAG: cell division protein ZipA C-terminal FtsZ-binding domain-containing protein, partial [Gammaproteobacteria bacterium]